MGSAAVQIAAAVGARVLGVAGAGNHDDARSLGASEVSNIAEALPLDQAREALSRVAGRYTRGKIVLQVGR